MAQLATCGVSNVVVQNDDGQTGGEIGAQSIVIAYSTYLCLSLLSPGTVFSDCTVLNDLTSEQRDVSGQLRCSRKELSRSGPEWF